MEKQRVVYVGLEPSLVDFSSLPGLDAEKVRAGIRAELERLAAAGYDATFVGVDLGETAARTLADALSTSRVDCVVIGAGVRTLPEHLALFEQLVNAVLSAAPTARLAFNTKPGDTLDAVRRWI
ncbi:MAG TPA: hypothetical protein VGM56_27125 [Byssovorax sp.]|jgi:hypothetical protein